MTKVLEDLVALLMFDLNKVGVDDPPKISLSRFCSFFSDCGYLIGITYPCQGTKVYQDDLVAGTTAEPRHL